MPSGMRLRESSMLRVPGRYQEDLGPSHADRPLFVHADVPFNTELSRHCAHPSLPLDYAGVGPSEAERARLAAREAARIEEEEWEGSVERTTDGEGSWEVATNGPATEDGSSDSDGEYRSARSGSRRGGTLRQGQALPLRHNRIVELTTSKPPRFAQPALPAMAAAPTGTTTTPAPPTALAGNTTTTPPAALASTTTPTPPTPSEPPSRPAHVANIPRRKPRQNSAALSDGSGDSIGGSTDGTRPNWADLSDGIKYAIICDMTRTAPLSRAVQSLGLDHVETTSLLGLIAEERKKKTEWAELLTQHPHSAESPPAEELAPLCPVNEGITAGDVRRGRAFLKFLGMGGVAARLGFWEGTGADFHEVQIDDGCRDLVDDFHFLAGSEGEGGSAKRLLNLKGGELLLRLDPPANTVNPLRLRPGAPLVRAKKLGLARVPLSDGLHPMNYTIGGKTGRRYSTLDKSDWPDWEALHDAGVIPEGSLAVFTAHSLVPAEITLLTEEELEVINAIHPIGMLGSASAAELGLDYEASDPPFAVLTTAPAWYDAGRAGRWTDPYPNAPRDWYANPSEDDFPIDLFGDNTSTSGTAVGRQRRRADAHAPTDELEYSQTVAEDEFSWGPAFAEDDDHEMASVSTRPPIRRISAPRMPALPRSRLGITGAHQSAAASVEQRGISEGDPIAAALTRLSVKRSSPSQGDPIAAVLDRLAKTQRPVVRQLAPEVAAIIDELTASVPKTQGRVHFEDDLPASFASRPPIPPRSPVPVIELEYPTDGEESRSEGSVDGPQGGRGPRARPADPDDDEYRPISKRPRARVPRARASNTRKRGRPDSPVAQTPKRPRTGRGPGRPRKYPLPNADLLGPPTPSPKRSITVRGLARQSSEQTATPQHPVTEGAQNPSSSLVANDKAEPEDPFLERPSGEPSITASSVPQGPKRPRSRKKSADEEGEGDEQAVKKRGPAKKRQPKLDEKGVPITPKKGRPRRTGPTFSCDGTKRMRSTEGEEMTRAEFDEVFTRDELVYRPGGNFGGGTFEIKATARATRRAKKLGLANATGTNASNNRAAEGQQNAPTAPGTLGQAASQPSITSTEDSDPQPGLSPPIEQSNQQTPIDIARPNAPTQTTPLPPQPAVTGPRTPTSTSAPAGITTPPAPRKPAAPAPRPRAPRPKPLPSASAAAAITATSATAPAAGAGPAIPPPPVPTAGVDPRVAARVAELNAQCVRYNVATRDRFDSDAAFLAHAEPMAELLFPNLGGGGSGSGGGGGGVAYPPAGLGPRFGGFDSFK
ncbi:uncharacterized protein B0H64DRAFT_374839 [Chaetomium fimeti]|uniref:Uncharacterized protein n=1 Tax=Chaetomium fimeti TaxID=1854472 RepID=A0AAE0HCN1_9PEZI|nr:hypothetical protein B0H64DRAFT_374839 [Chaetomium fimeti]